MSAANGDLFKWSMWDLKKSFVTKAKPFWSWKCISFISLASIILQLWHLKSLQMYHSAFPTGSPGSWAVVLPIPYSNTFPLPQPPCLHSFKIAKWMLLPALWRCTTLSLKKTNTHTQKKHCKSNCCGAIGRAWWISNTIPIGLCSPGFYFSLRERKNKTYCSL